MSFSLNVYKIHDEKCSNKTKDNLKSDCDQCEKTFDTKRLLARHKRNNHVTEKFTCETMTMNKSTRYWHVLREYENKIYNGVK